MARENAYFIAENSNGRYDPNELKQTLQTLPGVSSVYVDAQKHLVAVDYESSKISYDFIENRLNHLGYEIAADASLIHTR